MTKHYKHLGAYSGLVAAISKSTPPWPKARPGKKTQQAFLNSLSFDPGPAKPRQVRIDGAWERDGVAGQAVSWSVGYGPRTEAWVLRPAGVKGRLPGVIALHDHGGFKYFGKEKIAQGPGPIHPILGPFWDKYYGGRPFANALARRGFTVLVPDTFLWGSRKFDYATMNPASPPLASAPDVETVTRYNAAAGQFEHVVEKYLRVQGTTLSGLISYEDRVAADYLARRADVTPGGVGCVGLSGGGLRAGLMQGTCGQIRAAVCVGLMSTYEGLLDHNISCHTWMLYPGDWPARGDWPDMISCRAPSPLMVLYDIDDDLFTPRGQRAAHRKIAGHYKSVGRPGNYVGRFYPGPHKFDLPMQEDAFAWLREQLAAAGKSR